MLSRSAGERPDTAPDPLPDDAILELLPAAVYVCDSEGRVVRYNRRAAELWGREPIPGDPSERYCGAHRLHLPDGQPLDPRDTPMAEALRTGQPQRDVEVVLEQPSGRRFWVRVSIDPVRDASGRITGAINCFQDITAGKEAERKRLESEALLHAIIETTTECVKVVARDGTLLRMNSAGLRMIEAGDPSRALGGSTMDLIAPEDRDHWRSRHERVCDGERLRWEFDVIGLAGTRRHMETHAAPLAMPDGSVAQLAVTHDITRRKRDEHVLRESERELRGLFDALPMAVYTTDTAGRVTFFNPAAVELCGRPPDLDRDRWCIAWRLRRTDGTHLPHEEFPLTVALKEGRPARGVSGIVERPDGTRVPILAHSIPLFDAEGTPAGAVVMLLDTSDKTRADAFAGRLAAIVESSNDAIVSKDIHGIIQTWNRGAERMFGFRAEDVVGRPIDILIPPDRLAEDADVLRRIQRGEFVAPYETVRIRHDGTPLHVSLTVSPLRDADGTVVGVSKSARDITERRREEDRRRLLVNELNHRVKNTLATVQSIAAQTFRGTGDEESAQRFESRLVALARAHDILTRENWEGADCRELVAGVVASLCPEPDRRCTLAGPPVRLTPRTALLFAMAHHELCTNAAKYGALSDDNGRVAITWHEGGPAGDRRLHLRWEESGGPPVEPPRRAGFGMRLLEGALARDLGAEVRLSFPPTGVVCEIEVPRP